MQAAAAVADAAVAKPTSPATNSGLVWNGSAWVAALLVNGNIDPAANIVYSKLSLAGSIVNNDISSGAAIAYSKLSVPNAAVPISALADPGAGKVVGSTGSGAVAVTPPGTLLNYTQVTSGTVAISSTTEATPTTIITAGAITGDGSTVVMLEFFSPQVNAPTTSAGNVSNLSFYEGSTELGQIVSIICQVAGQANVGAAYGRLKLTPSNASHTYSVGGWCSGSTTNAGVLGDVGGTAKRVPMFIRITTA